MTSALAGFHAGALSWSNWNWNVFVFLWSEETGDLEKNPWNKVRTNKKLNPHIRSTELEL